ncbi:MAG: DUF1552 domain-containing protein [Pirellula sp.]|jgi:hypothetical protein|nr:DUF1552 domain-containing protein [Pirellula sp.]
MSQKRISRRTVLRGLGTAISLPLLEAMLPSRAAVAAGASEAPLRMLYLMVPNGIHMPAWTPSGDGSKFELAPSMKPLEKFREHLSVFTGLTLDGARDHGDGGGDHARSGASFLTGAHPRKTDGADIKNGVSVDQVAATAIGHKTRFASLELGLEGSSQSGNCDSGYSCAYSSNLAWRNESSPLAKEMDPSAVFDRLFGTADKVSNGAQRSAKAARRKSILDFALEDANQLKRRLGMADQRKLDEYLYAVRDVENRMARTDKLSVGEDGLPNYTRPAGVPRVWEEHCKLMMDMIALAVRTDSTRILTFMLANEGSNRGYPEIGAPESHHDLSHHGKSEEKQTKLQKINEFHMHQFAYLAEQLASVPEGNGNLLQNCMIIYGSGISDGDRHNHDDLPIIMLGNAGGRIKKPGHHKFPQNTPLCNLYLWMLHQVGVKADRFGDSTDVLNFT